MSEQLELGYDKATPLVITDREIQRLASAIISYERWQSRMLKFRQEQRFKRRLKRQLKSIEENT